MRSACQQLALLPKRSLQSRLRETEAGDGARPIELRLEPRGLRVERVGAGGNANPVAPPCDAFGLDGGTNFFVGGADCFMARRELELPLLDFEGCLAIELLGAVKCRLGICPRFTGIRGPASRVPQRPREIDGYIPRRPPIPAARKDAGIR